ncbi:MAG: serine hydrolase domain-containing protein [Kineosporiaceae bacterium]|jgi:CubicO group peptidase (beta-lactamase class C family)
MPTEHTFDRGRPSGMAAVHQRVTAELRRARVPGLSLAVFTRDRVLYAAGFGSADLTSAAPVTPTTGFLWFSMSKIATATVTMTLVDDGSLGLDDLAVSHLPEFGIYRAADRVTVRHLLNHTSGLANPVPVRWVTPADGRPPDSSALLRRLLPRHRRPSHEVGGSTHYSNLGYLVVAELVARVAGAPFEDVVAARLLRPASMARTGYRVPPGQPAATGHHRAPAVLRPVFSALLPAGILGPRVGGYLTFRPFYVVGAGYGGLIGDVLDVARLGMLHLGDGTLGLTRVLSPGSAVLMRTVDTRGTQRDVGLGWFRSAPDRGAGPSFVEHLGGGGGFHTDLRIYPDLDLGVALMGNSSSAYDHHALCSALVDLDWGPGH